MQWEDPPGYREAVNSFLAAKAERERAEREEVKARKKSKKKNDFEIGPAGNTSCPVCGSEGVLRLGWMNRNYCGEFCEMQAAAFMHAKPTRKKIVADSSLVPEYIRRQIESRWQD